MLETIITSSVLIAVLSLLRCLFKGKISLQLQYALWLLVAVRLLMPFSISESSFSVLNIIEIGSRVERIENPAVLPLPAPAERTDADIDKEIPDAADGSEASRYSAQDKTTGSGITTNERALLKDILYTVLLTGAIAVGLWFVIQNIWFYTRLRKTREAAEMPDSRLPVYLSYYIKSPCLFGLFRPAIYIHPDSLSDGQAMKYILAHEETHYRHGDHIWAYLRCVCLALHWFNPLVWWAAVLSRRDCELACDESTLNRIGDEHRKAYGNTLINMIERCAKPSDLLCGATTMTSGKSGIKERITMLAKKPKMLLTTLIAVLLITAAIIGCTFTGANQTKIEPLTDKELSYLEPTSPKLSPGQSIGVDMVQLDYASEDIVIFHDYFGLFVYDLNSKQIVRSLDLNPIGCTATQGDNYCEVLVSTDGNTVQLHPMSSKNMYVYTVSDNTLREVIYERMENRFTGFVDIVDVIDYQKAGNYSHHAVRFDTGEYGYLHTSDWTLGTLTYVRGGDMLYRLFEFNSSVGEWELVSRADVNEDNREEAIFLDKSQIRDGSVTIRVLDVLGIELWNEQLSTSHAGWGSLFLCELDGRQYLLRYNPAMFQGYCTYMYTLFTLGDGKEKVVQTNTVEFDINGTKELEAPKMIAYAEEINALLGKSILLLSSEGGEFYFGPSTAEPFFERYSWLDDHPELFEKGDDLETRLNKYSEYAISNRI